MSKKALTVGGWVVLAVALSPAYAAPPPTHLNQPAISEDLEKQFAKESTAAGFDGLKGHRSVGGLRASIYNASLRRASTPWWRSCGSSRSGTGEGGSI